MKKICLLIITVFFLGFVVSCTPNKARIDGNSARSSAAKETPQVITHVDALPTATGGYIIKFDSIENRDAFLESYYNQAGKSGGGREESLKNAVVQSTDSEVYIQLPPADDSAGGTGWVGASEQSPGFVEQAIKVALVSVDSLKKSISARLDEKVIEDIIDISEPRPVRGGRAVIYLQRGFMDDAVSDMVRLNPFGEDGQNRKIFLVTDSTHRRLELKLASSVTRGNGRKATALDFVELWSRLLKSRPAQGLALFRNVQGAENFVNGKEPLVSGFNAADEQTIRIRFAKPDPVAFQRLSSPKLIGGPFMLGAYYSGGSKDALMRLLPNANSLAEGAAYLAECSVQMGGDPDPIVTFSLGQYAAMTLYQSSDIEAAKTEFPGASLKKLPSDRYFLACKSEDEQVRRFVRSAVNGRDMLENVAKAEGEEIYSVAAKNETAEYPGGHITVPQPVKAFRVIYREDDPISAAVAEKLSGDLNKAGMKTEALPLSAEKYETSLVRGTYDCAVGWVSETVLANFTEKLHLATMWFGDEMDSQSRLRGYREIPLFSVNHYLLLREDMKLYRDRVSGMWVDKNSR